MVALAIAGAAIYAVIAVRRRSWLMLVTLLAAVLGPLLMVGAAHDLAWAWEREIPQVAIAVCAVVAFALAAIGVSRGRTLAALIAVGLLVIPNAILGALVLFCELSRDPAGCYWMPVLASLAVVPISLLTGGGIALWSAVATRGDNF